MNQIEHADTKEQDKRTEKQTDVQMQVASDEMTGVTPNLRLTRPREYTSRCFTGSRVDAYLGTGTQRPSDSEGYCERSYVWRCRLRMSIHSHSD